jgi:hypothetical protein
MANLAEVGGTASDALFRAFFSFAQRAVDTVHANAVAHLV